MADLTKLLEEVKGMSVLELNDFVKMLEEEFGVSAAAMAVAAPAARRGGGGGPPPPRRTRGRSTSSLKRLAATRLPLSRLSARSPVSGFPRLKRLLTELPPPLRKVFPKRPPRKLPASLRMRAQLPSLSKTA